MVSERVLVMRAIPLTRKYRGLYCGLRCGIQKLQKWADALRPGSFIVLGTLNALIGKILGELPALLQKDVAKLFNIVNDSRAFVGPDIEPDARARLDGSGRCEAMNNALIPPHRRRQCREPAEDLRILESEIQRH